MELLNEAQREQMLANGRANAGREDSIDFPPVVRLLCPWSNAVWLLTELDPDDPDIAFGLCDPGLGFPELGSVRLSEMEAIEGPCGLRIVRDETYVPTRTLSTYARFARTASRTDE
jgi:hypothetical protein